MTTLEPKADLTPLVGSSGVLIWWMRGLEMNSELVKGLLAGAGLPAKVKSKVKSEEDILRDCSFVDKIELCVKE